MIATLKAKELRLRACVCLSKVIHLVSGRAKLQTQAVQFQGSCCQGLGHVTFLQAQGPFSQSSFCLWQSHNTNTIASHTGERISPFSAQRRLVNSVS